MPETPALWRSRGAYEWGPITALTPKRYGRFTDECCTFEFADRLRYEGFGRRSARVCSRGGPDPGAAAGGRSFVYNLIRGICAPGRRGAPRVSEWVDIAGGQNARNFEYFSSYIARILDRLPLKRAPFLYPPAMAGFENAAESLIRKVPGAYSQTCRNSIFLPGKRAGDSDISITPIREYCMLLALKEVDADAPRRNATSKRRPEYAPSR